MGISYKGSQGQTEKAVALQDDADGLFEPKHVVKNPYTNNRKLSVVIDGFYFYVFVIIITQLYELIAVPFLSPYRIVLQEYYVLSKFH